MWYEVVWEGDWLSFGIPGVLQVVKRSMSVAAFFPKGTAARDSGGYHADCWFSSVSEAEFWRDH
jgi:hypothetical protein